MKEKLMPYIDYDAILRFLHYRKADVELSVIEKIDEALNIVYEQSAFLEVHKKYCVEIRDNVLLLDNRIELPYPSLVELLAPCDETFIVACTLGHEISRRIKLETASNPAQAIILDSCASMVADAFAAHIQSTLGYTTNRFSPGYCEVPLSTQPIFAKLLDMERKTGIHLTAGNLMVPEKSIIYLAGVLDRPETRKQVSCLECRKDCLYRKTNLNI